jgi:hypothetical protein
MLPLGNTKEHDYGPFREISVILGKPSVGATISFNSW